MHYQTPLIPGKLIKRYKRFFADVDKFRYDSARQRIEVSPILKWFAEDFGADRAAQLQAIMPYLPDESSQVLERSGQVKISYLDYDWGLNDQAQR